MCTREDTLAHILGMLYIDDVMSYNLLTTQHITMYAKENVQMVKKINFVLMPFKIEHDVIF